MSAELQRCGVLDNFADGEEAEADLFEGGVVEEVARVEEEGGLAHGGVNLFPVKGFVAVPFGHEKDGIGACGGEVGVCFKGDIGEVREVFGGIGEGLWVGDDELGVFFGKEVGNRKGGGFAGVASIGLKGKAKEGNAFAGEGVKHGMDGALNDATLLGVVHLNNFLPVVGTFIQAIASAEVDEVEHVFLKTGATKAWTRFEEVFSNAVVGAEDMGHFIDVCASFFAEGGEGVDGGDALGQHCIGGEFGEFAGPNIGRDNAFAWHPGCVDFNEALNGGKTLFILRATDKDAVGMEEVLDSCAFGEEFRV